MDKVIELAREAGVYRDAPWRYGLRDEQEHADALRKINTQEVGKC